MISIKHLLPRRGESKVRGQNLCGKVVDEEDSYQQELQKLGHLSTRTTIINTYLTTRSHSFTGEANIRIAEKVKIAYSEVDGRENRP